MKTVFTSNRAPLTIGKWTWPVVGYSITIDVSLLSTSPGGDLDKLQQAVNSGSLSSSASLASMVISSNPTDSSIWKDVKAVLEPDGDVQLVSPGLGPISVTQSGSQIAIVNDLTSGGVSAALSAEQGRQLQLKKYEKPSSGIPSSDLSSSVQTAISLASSALQVAPVTTVSGKVGDVSLSKTDVGLYNVDNTADIDKPVSTAQATAINAKYTKPTNGIPSTDLDAGTQGVLSSVATKYVAPVGGIPATDLDSATQASLASIASKYQLPAGGVPVGDLESTVQTILSSVAGKYVRPTNGIPATDLDTATQTVLTSVASKYVKPGSGIPESDLDTSTQSKLDNAAQVTGAGQIQGPSLNAQTRGIVVNTISALRSFNNSNVTSVWVSGYYSALDGGEGSFQYVSSDTTSSDNGGTIIVDGLGRRWYRSGNQLYVTARQFGATPDETSGGLFDNLTPLNNMFTWAITQQTSPTCDLESYTYSVSAPPVIGIGGTSGSPNQAQPVTITGSASYRMAGKHGARILLKATSLGQFTSILKVDGTQQSAWLTIQNLRLECPQISANVAAQTPSGNAIVITGATAANFVTGTPVQFTGGGGGTEVTRGGNTFYWLIYTGTTDTFKLALNPTDATNGTAITLTTSWTGTTTCTATTGSALHGLYFSGTRLTSPRLRQVTVANADNGFTLEAVSGTSNGEFAHFYQCEAFSVRRFLYLSSSSGTGQALETTVQNCSCQPRLADGISVFEYGGDASRGYGITAISMDASVTPIPSNTGEYRNKICYVKDNGTSDSNTFIGGRVENITTIYEGSNSYFNEQTKISGVTFAGICSTSANPMINITTSTIPSSGGSLEIDTCNIYAPSTAWAVSNVKVNVAATNTSAMRIAFRKTSFDISKFSLLQGTTSSSLEFDDCTQRIVNSSLGTVLYKRFSRKIGGHSAHPMTLRSDRHSSAAYPGVPSNLLIYPNFGNAFGATITAPSPWVHTGAAAFNRLDMLSTVATPSARRIRLEASSGVKQVLNITPTAGTPLYYQANVWVYFMATSSDRMRIALENDTTGEVYDEIFMGAQAANQHSSVISLVATPNATVAGQYYRLVIQNLGTANVNQLQMNWQLVSLNANAAYITPATDGSTQEQTTVWDANMDTARVFNRLSIPYKTDQYGQSTNQQDTTSDVYLSQTNERIIYSAGSSQAAGAKWWSIPRVYFASAMPSSGSWTANDYVQNTAWAEQGTAGSKYIIKGWMRLTTGSGNVLNTDWFQDRSLTGN